MAADVPLADYEAEMLLKANRASGEIMGTLEGRIVGDGDRARVGSRHVPCPIRR